MEKILTVVIPSYNIEKYIDHTMNSFLEAQEIFEDLEILIVNDGSKDRTSEMAHSYEKRFLNTVRVIDKANGGHGSVINRGIEEAKGKYYKVVDGDDWVSPENLIKCVAYLKQCDADLVLSPYLEHYEKDNTEKEISFMSKIDGICDLEDVCSQMSKISIHGLIVKTSLLRDNCVVMDENTFYEDAEYVCYPVPYAQTVAYFEYPIVVYRVGTEEQSMNKNNLWKRREQHLRVLNALIAFYRSLNTSGQKKEYLKRCIAMVAEGQYRIYYLGPIQKTTKTELREFDKELKKLCPEIYSAVQYKLIRILRCFGFPCYKMTALIYQNK